MESGSTRTRVRVAAAVLAGLLVAAAVFTYLGYTAAFTPTKTVTVSSPRAGLVMEPDAKVKFRGIQVGKVTSIDYHAKHARLTLAIESGQLRYMPSNVTVRIASNTIFGAKSVEFLPPADPTGKSLQPGATVQASAVQLEVNTLFETLTEVLDKVDPVHLNGTLTALAEGLRGHGDDLGATLAGLNTYLAEFNPMLPTMESDFAKTATVADIYADTAPDLVRIIDNVPTISNTLVEEQDNLNAALLSATGLANNGYDALAPAADDFIAGIKRFRALGSLLAEYSPEFGCLFKSLARAAEVFGPSIGGTNPALFVDSNFIPARPPTPIRRACPTSVPPAGRTAVAYPIFPANSSVAPGSGHRSS